MTAILKTVKVLILLILIMLMANFALNNQAEISVDLGPFAKYINIKLYIFAILVFILGAGATSLFFILDSFRKSIELKKKSWFINKLEKELYEAKSLNSPSGNSDIDLNHLRDDTPSNNDQAPKTR